jgi:hypothetical protein
MAKGNYQNTYATIPSDSPDISSWVMQQEKMNLYMDKYQKDLLKDAEEKKLKQQEAAKKRLEETGYGKNPDFKLTGTEALDYNVRLLTQEALQENFRLDQEIKQMEQNGELDIFKQAELKQKKDLLFKLPENLAAAQEKYRLEVESFQQGIQEGSILPTPENLQRLKRMKDGDYKISLNPDNYAEFSVVFDKDGDGIEDFIPFSEFMSDNSIGRKIKNFNLRGEALKVAEQIGTLEQSGYDGFYKKTSEGIKYDDDQLYNLVSNIAQSSPDQLDSFAYQRFGKTADKLSDQEEDVIVRDFISHLKSAINEKNKSEFDSGLAGHNLATNKFNYEKQRDKIEDGQWWADFNLRKSKGDKDSDPNVINKDFVQEGAEKTPTYGLNGYEITIDKAEGTPELGKVKIKATALKAKPLGGGKYQLKVSDGTKEYDLQETDLAQLKSMGITREVIQSDYNNLNNTTPKKGSLNSSNLD